MMVKLLQNQFFNSVTDTGMLEFRAGIHAPVLTKAQYEKLPPARKGSIAAAKRRYDERGEQGYWVLLGGMYRFVKRSDCEVVK